MKILNAFNIYDENNDCSSSVLVSNTSVSGMSQSLMKPVELLTSGVLFVEFLQLLSSKE